jgi:hypothetical protein
METVRDKTIAAIRAAFQMQSPSVLMMGEGVNITAGIAQGILQGIPLASVAMTALGTALIAIASAQGASAGVAYGSAFGTNASLHLSLAIDEIKRQLTLLEIRISRGFGSTQ